MRVCCCHARMHADKQSADLLVVRALCEHTQKSAHTVQGPSVREARRDVTSFETARTEWSRATVSARGMVGAEGDHGQEVWLG